MIVIVGAGWYTNFRLYDRDKAAMKQELLFSLREEARSIIETTAAKSRAELSEAIEASAAQSSGRLNSMHRDLNTTRYQVLEIEANQHEAAQVWSNVLRTYLKMIRVGQELGYEFYVSRSIGQVIRVLKIIAKKDVSHLEGDLASDVTRMLDSLGSEFSVDVDTIRQLLRTARAK